MLSAVVYRLTFMLPDTLAFAVPTGRHQPCLHGCVLTIGRGGLVTVEGPSRERVFEQVSRFMRIVARKHPPASIGAVLSSARGRDHWQIIVGAEVAFAPTAVEAIVHEQSTAGR